MPESRVSDVALFQGLRSGTAEAERCREALVDRYTGLALWAARRYTGRGEDFEELRQVAFIGLLQAVRRFDPSRGTPFVSFAQPTILGELRRHCRDARRWVRVPRQVQENSTLVRDARDRLAVTGNHMPSAAEIAAHLNISPDDVVEAMASEQFFEPDSIEGPVHDDPESGSLAERLRAEGDEVALLVDVLALRSLLAGLPERDRRLLQLRFGADLTQDQIGAQLGMSQMHVSRLLRKVLGELRTQLEEAA